jgi:hypothetical protein
MLNSTQLTCCPDPGSLQEILYSLMSHGIPKLILPIDEEGGVEVVRHTKWFAEHQKSEQAQAVTRNNSTASCSQGDEVGGDNLVLPNEKDILLGRGLLIEGHTGNLVFKRIIENNYARYQMASRFERTIVAHALYLRMKESGFRFLKKTGGDWIEVDEVVARSKIAHAFRNYRARRPSSSQLNTIATGTAAHSALSLDSNFPRCFF